MSVAIKNQQFTIYHSTKQDGNMGFEFGEADDVIANREKFLRKNGINEPIREIQNCHSSNVACVSLNSVDKSFYINSLLNPENEKLISGIDGLLTFDDIAICGITGDCIPLVVWEPESNLHGLIHIGLLGGLNGIVTAFKELIGFYSIDAQYIRFYLGPCITVRNYNISKSGVWKQIGEKARQIMPDIDDYIRITNGQQYFDTKKFVIDSLIRISAKSENITTFDYCTAEKDSLFYSHYYLINNNLPNARFLTVIR